MLLEKTPTTAGELGTQTTAQFISKMRTDYFPNVGGAGIDKIKLQGAIKELNVETAPGKSFTILTTEW